MSFVGAAYDHGLFLLFSGRYPMRLIFKGDLYTREAYSQNKYGK